MKRLFFVRCISVRLAALAVALLGVVGAFSPAWAVGSIEAAVDKPQVTIGEPLTYTVTMILPPGAQAQLPGEKAQFKLLEVRDYKPTQTPLSDGSQTILLKYTLVCFDTGTQGVKDFKVPVKLADGKTETWLAPPQEFTVASVLPKNGKAEPKGFYGPIMLKSPWADWLYAAAIALVVLALAALAIWLWRRRKRPGETTEVEVILPADDAALRALRRLADENPIAAGDLAGFYARLNETLRAWLQARFDVPAMERTTLGITYHLRVRRDMDEWRGQYLELLKISDQVRYANLLPSDSEAYANLEQAEQVIRLACPPPSAETAASDLAEELQP